MRSHSSLRTVLTWLNLSALVIGLIVIPFAQTRASNPSSGTISPTGPTVNWTGTATGGTYATKEPLGGSTSKCQVGVDCDTFALNVSGTAADWAGKQINVTISWLTPAYDYDLFIYKGADNTGPLVDSSGNPPGIAEEATISPAETLPGLYTVYVVY